MEQIFFNQKIKSVNGITLVELIMTIVLIGIIVIPSSIFIIETIKGAFKSEDITVAVNLARLELERINNMTYGDVTSDEIPNYWGDDDSHPNLSKYDLAKVVRRLEHSGNEMIKEIKIELYPAGELGNSDELITTVIIHKAKYVE